MKNSILNIIIILLILLSLLLIILGINNIYKGEIISGIVIVGLNALNAWSLINCYTYFKNK
jgi:TM2 domain-containing membrane protein YozV